MLPEAQILVMNSFDHSKWTGYACVEDELKKSSNVIWWCDVTKHYEMDLAF